ncbi:T9SS type A sorting domain-containing protein [Bizionia sediminis]|uniref:T9SS type A sorting domain-containing protein n=1 Tax=Bizionia sediminis TaxID=1737064 RepID=A0ABW5KVP1_9FLAO
MKKTTTKNLTKRLAKYGALTAAMAGIADASGQIVYTDITDFTGGSPDEYLLDLNNDGTNDFSILNNGNLFVSALDSGNEVIGSVPYASYPYGYPFALNANTVVSNNMNGTWLDNYNGYSGSVLPSLNWGGFDGNWINVTDKFLGLRFNISGNTHYGWVRMDVNEAGVVWTIKDYAYEATANAPITAGATLNVPTEAINNIKVVATNNTIKLFNLPESTNYELFNVAGQNVLQGNSQGKLHTINTNNLATGMYVLAIIDSETGKSFRKKVVL